jgi:hypothetical protein
MDSVNIEIFSQVYKQLEQAAQETQTSPNLLANAMIEFLCELLQRRNATRKETGLVLQLQVKVLNFEGLTSL